MAFIIDNRQGLGKSVTVELQTESERTIGVDNTGKPRVVYFLNAPQVIIKTTYRVVGTEKDWDDLINSMDDAYRSITTVPQGKFIESADVGNGWFIIKNEDFYGGSYTEVDYSNLDISEPPEEFKIFYNESASVAPAGYLPSGLAYYSTGVAGIRYTRSSVAKLSVANEYRVGKNYPDLGGFITSKSLSNLRLLNDIDYVDLSLDIVELEASIDIF